MFNEANNNNKNGIQPERSRWKSDGRAGMVDVKKTVDVALWPKALMNYYSYDVCRDMSKSLGRTIYVV